MSKITELKQEIKDLKEAIESGALPAEMLQPSKDELKKMEEELKDLEAKAEKEKKPTPPPAEKKEQKKEAKSPEKQEDKKEAPKTVEDKIKEGIFVLKKKRYKVSELADAKKKAESLEVYRSMSENKRYSTTIANNVNDLFRMTKRIFSKQSPAEKKTKDEAKKKELRQEREERLKVVQSSQDMIGIIANEFTMIAEGKDNTDVRKVHGLLVSIVDACYANDEPSKLAGRKAIKDMIARNEEFLGKDFVRKFAK